MFLYAGCICSFLHGNILTFSSSLNIADVIPKQFDPGYLEGDDPPESDDSSDATRTTESGNKNDSSNFSDPLSRALPTKQSYQNIRALPRRAGESIIFTHRILHWVSKSLKVLIVFSLRSNTHNTFRSRDQQGILMLVNYIQGLRFHLFTAILTTKHLT